MGFRDSHPRTLARPLPISALAGRDTGCRKKLQRIPDLFRSLAAPNRSGEVPENLRVTRINTNRHERCFGQRNPFNPRNLRSNSADAEADVADGFATEALL